MHRRGGERPPGTAAGDCRLGLPAAAAPGLRGRTTEEMGTAGPQAGLARGIHLFQARGSGQGAADGAKIPGTGRVKEGSSQGPRRLRREPLALRERGRGEGVVSCAVPPSE